MAGMAARRPTRPVRTAVIPAAGLGTRFLPASKATPKEMVTLVDRPAIQWVVEEAVAAGIERVCVVLGRNKQSVEDHFDRSPELEASLEASGKHDLLATVRAIAELADMSYVRQGTPKGLGHAVAAARAVVGDEPCCVLLPDDIMSASAGVLAGMLTAYQETGTSVVALKVVEGDAISAYGSATVGEDGSGYPRLTDVVEKPKPGEAPSQLAVLGRYVFTPGIFAALEKVQPGALGELQLTDGFRLMAADADEGVHGYVFSEGRFDVGNKADYLAAMVELALDDPVLGAGFADVLRAIVRRRGLAR